MTETQAGRTLAHVVRELFGELSWSQARELCRRGKVQRNGAVETDAAVRVALGDEVTVTPHAPRVREHLLPENALLHVDAQVVVVNKPAGLISVPFENGDKNTLVDRVRMLLRRQGAAHGGAQGPELGAVQRLDKDTTGVMVFARTLAAKRHLQQQFRVHSIERRYLAIVHGQLQAASFDTLLIRDRGDGLRGSYGHFRRPTGPAPAAAQQAQRAITHVAPLESLHGASLVECKLETGRQHQIRIHLSEAGHPLVGEPVYIRDFTQPRLQAPRPMLHAETLGFVHPRTEQTVRFTVPPPQDFQTVLERLRH